MFAKIGFLLLGFFVFIIGVGYLFSYLFGNSNILYLAVGFSVLMSLVSYWFSDKIVLKMARAKEIKEAENPAIYKILKNLCLKANLPLPKVYLIKEQQPNAFATGRDKNHAVVALTEGLLAKLNSQEIEGVIGHELSHIQNRDTLLQTMVVILVGFVSILSRWFFWGQMFGGRKNNQSGGILSILGLVVIILAPLAATLIRLAISRKREFLADESAAYLTVNPGALASALEKIAADKNPIRNIQEATAHLYIANPLKASGVAKLFMTHPPIEERVRALRTMHF